jgi:hypothetical protein
MKNDLGFGLRWQCMLGEAWQHWYDLYLMPNLSGHLLYFASRKSSAMYFPSLAVVAAVSKLLHCVPEPHHFYADPALAA